MSESITIAARFCGPPQSGNGGYSCGVLGARLGGPAEVTLRRPPPLDRPMLLERDARGLRMLDGEHLVAEAVPTPVTLEAPLPPTLAEATDASTRYPWRTDHPYPTCFVCGPRRAPGDGLCIFPGALPERRIACAPFVPDATLADESGRVREEIMWAALDCPSWFGFGCFERVEGLLLLGRLAARIDTRPRVGEPCVSVGWALDREGRKIRCGSALFSEKGELLAIAHATWITLK